MKKLSLKNYYSAERIIGLVFLALGLLGLYDSIYGEWSTGSGYGTTFFPQLTFILLIAIGVVFQFYFKKNKTKVVDRYDITTLVLLLGTGAIYFLMVRRIGLITSSFVYGLALVTLLTTKPRKNYKSILIAGLVGTVLIWLVFTKLVDLVVPRAILF